MSKAMRANRSQKNFGGKSASKKTGNISNGKMKSKRGADNEDDEGSDSGAHTNAKYPMYIMQKN